VLVINSSKTTPVHLFTFIHDFKILGIIEMLVADSSTGRRHSILLGKKGHRIDRSDQDGDVIIEAYFKTDGLG
jgi:hypothetical protein